MPEATLQLDHLNIPARDPEQLARWYADTFGLTANAHVVRGPGVLIAFQRGEPLNRATDFHIGMRVPSRALLMEWAGKFGAQPTAGTEFTTFRTLDPDGNCIELYCKTEG